MRARNRVGSWPERPARFKVVALLALLVLLAAACGGGSGEDPSEAADGGDAASEPAGGEGELASCMDSTEPVELLVWGSRDYYLPPDNFEGFMEKYPHITIKTDVQANDDVLQQLQRMKQAGQKAPDVV